MQRLAMNKAGGGEERIVDDCICYWEESGSTECGDPHAAFAILNRLGIVTFFSEFQGCDLARNLKVSTNFYL